jgi:hypothetical protein
VAASHGTNLPKPVAIAVAVAVAVAVEQPTLTTFRSDLFAHPITIEAIVAPHHFPDAGAPRRSSTPPSEDNAHES